MALTLTAQEIASFDGRHRLTTVRGPLSLFRLCGSNAAGARGNPYGRFWFNERFFWDIVDRVSDASSSLAQRNHTLRFLLREFTAVSHDWNSFGVVYQLTLPPAQQLEVAVGRIAPQPYFSASDPHQRQALPHQMLMGGEFQYIVDLASDPTLKRYVQGPRPMWVHSDAHA